MEDFCGKIILENPIVLKYFISAVLKIPVEKLAHVRLMDPFLHRIFSRDKEGILDVLVELEDKRKINIEIQVEKAEYWDRRSIFYLAKLYIKGFRRGGEYRDLKECVNISILDFDYLNTDDYHSIVQLRYGNGKLYSSAIELHVIELRKMKRWQEKYAKEFQQGSEEVLPIVDEYEEEVQEWVRFFSCKTEKEVEELSVQTKNPGIREAIKELLSVNAGELFEARFQEKLKQRRDKVAREDFVRNEGHIEGCIEEHAGVIKAIRKKIQKGFSVHEAAEALEQEETDVSEIYELINQNPQFSDLKIAKIVIDKKKN